MWFFSVLLAACRPGESPDQEERDFVGSLLDGMEQSLTMHARFRGRPAEELTPDERDYLRRDLLDLRQRNIALGMSLPKIKDQAELAAFLNRWQLERLEAALQAHPEAKDGIDADVRRLRVRFPVNTWRSPFARFPKVR